MSKDTHSVEEQLNEVKTAKAILDQFALVWGAYVEAELKAQRNPATNPTVKDVCGALVELELGMAEMVDGLIKAQALEELDSTVEILAQKAFPNPGQPF
jgi:hypothetical protein